MGISAADVGIRKAEKRKIIENIKQNARLKNIFFIIPPFYPTACCLS
jgi:hypothetical protein